MLGSSWSAIQAYILRASESYFLKFVMLGTPSFILLQRMSAESRNKNPCIGVGIRAKEKEKHGLGYWGKNCHSKTCFLNKPTKVHLINHKI